MRALLITIPGVLAMAAPAGAAIISGELQLPAYSKGTPTGGGGATVKLNWLPATFSPPGGNDRQDLRVVDTSTSGVLQPAVTSTASTIDLGLVDGHPYNVEIAACIATSSCFAQNPIGVLNSAGSTRVDATPPSGTMVVNGGAAFTNKPEVTLNMTASDPLVSGIPNSAAGVNQFAVDVDGNGTYPCSLIFLNGADTSGCAQAFTTAGTATLPSGDGVKVVGVKFGDAARTIVAPCTGLLCLHVFGPQTIEGNESASVTDSIVLDTQKPTGIVTPATATVPQGGSVTFNSASSTDPGAAASGVDAASTAWDFKDGTPVVTGGQVTHTFAKAGTFTGQMVVKDKAGNVSDVRQFSVNVTGTGGQTTGGQTGGGSRRTPRGLTLSVVHLGGAVTVSGALKLPSGATCAGVVRLTVRRGRSARLVRAKLAAKRGACAYSARLRGASGARISARFAGTAALTPLAGPTRRA
ncbi:MAG: PKD domain-containing protein [Thermoleophilia bacterium]